MGSYLSQLFAAQPDGAPPLVNATSKNILNHGDYLRAAYQRSPNAPVFKLARPGSHFEWDTITYAQLYDHVQRAAHFFTAKLASLNVLPGDVVSILFDGVGEYDAALLIALFEAGFVPQVLRVGLTPNHIATLAEKANSKALIISPAHPKQLQDPESINGLPQFIMLSRDELESDKYSVPENAPPFPSRTGPLDVAAILATSGTTSGIPKIVPLTNMWQLNSTINLTIPGAPDDLRAANWAGSLCHISTYLSLLATLRNGTFLTQPHSLPLKTDELVQMVNKAGISRLVTFGTILTDWLSEARRKPEVLKALQSLKQLWYTGAPISLEDEGWCFSNGIPIISLFASTENGFMLHSVLDGTPTARYLRTLSHNPLTFRPSIKPSDDAPQLYELIIPSTSPTAPHPSLLDDEGNYPTGDLFEQVHPGLWHYKGRNDDWIKMHNALLVNTGPIEDAVRAQSWDLITGCVVVGARRPHLALLIEPKDASVYDDPTKQLALKAEIILRHTEDNASRLPWERLNGPEVIVVVPKDSLPRTALKGTIRRKAVEDTFKAEIDALYPSTAPCP